jgi:hypothetical protein
MEHLKRFGTGVAALMFALFICWLVYLLCVVSYEYTVYVIGILAIPGSYFFGWLLRAADDAGKETAEALSADAAAVFAKELNND